MSQVFISYSRKDKLFVDYLAFRLSKINVPFWLDRHDIQAGNDWSDLLDNALKSCNVMVLIVSPDSMGSSYVRDEWKYFLAKKKPVIPLILKHVELPPRLSHLQYIDDFTLVGGFDAGFGK